VGIIGTGATAVQCVPHLGEYAQELFVFQRTPSCVDVRGNQPTDPEFEKGLVPGWQHARMTNFNTLVGGGYQEEDLVSDGWTDIFRNLVKLLMAAGDDVSPEDVAAKAELADFQKMEEIRARVDSIVVDPECAEALKPYYRQFCKRPCFHDDYLPTFNRDSVTLVDTQGRGVERVTERGVVVDGKEYELDCLIFATGFEVGTSYTRRAGYDVIGRTGSLTEKWADGMSTFHGFFTHGFPNCFFMMGFQSGLTANIPHAIDEQSRHLAHIVGHALQKGIASVEATVAAESAWVQGVRKGQMDPSFQRDCTPGYYNNEGKPDEGDGWYGGMHGEGSEAFFQLLIDWRAAGTFEGLRLEKGEP
jgi:cyclohexanone monooxygenase